MPGTPVNPLKERDETLAVLDAWGDSYGGAGTRHGFGRWIIAALVVAGAVLGTMAAFPGAIHWLTSP